jgi:hypothetical protein
MMSMRNPDMSVVLEHIEKNPEKYGFAFVLSVENRFYALAYKRSSDGYLSLMLRLARIKNREDNDDLVTYEIPTREAHCIDGRISGELSTKEYVENRMRFIGMGKDLTMYNDYDILSIMLYELNISSSGNQEIASQLNGIMLGMDKKWAILHCMDEDFTVQFLCRRIMSKEGYICL